MTPTERRSTAIHEAGHATVMWRLKHCDPVLKVTIIPRGRSLGATWYLAEERVNMNVEHFMHKMAGLLGGRLSEQKLMDVVSTGAVNDLERTSKIAYSMVAYYGMSPAVGQISYYDSTGQRDTFTKPFSEQTALTIDREVRRLIDEAAALASEIIDRERDNIERLADMLYRARKLTGSADAKGDLSTYADAGTVSDWAAEAMAWAVGEGFLSGKGDGRLDPQGTATRAEVASMLQRFWGKQTPIDE